MSELSNVDANDNIIKIEIPQSPWCLTEQEKEDYFKEAAEAAARDSINALYYNREKARKEVIRCDERIMLYEGTSTNIHSCPHCYSDKVHMYVSSNKKFVQIKCDNCKAATPRYHVKKRCKTAIDCEDFEDAQNKAVHIWNNIF